MMPLPPTVRRPMLPSSRIVWASKPPSMNTLLTPGVVPNPSLRQIYGSIIALWLVPHKEQRQLAFALPTKAQARPRGLLSIFIHALRSTGIDAISTITKPKQRDLGHRLTVHSPRLEYRRNEGIRLKLS